MPTESSGSTGKKPDNKVTAHKGGGTGSQSEVSWSSGSSQKLRVGYRKTGTIATKIQISADLE